MRIIAGLGNPGLKYETTRHNIGFIIADNLAIKHKIEINKEKFSSQYSRLEIANCQSILVKPQTYMNKSGYSIVSFLNFFKSDIDDLVVIHDDADLEFGRIKLKLGGGDGGHNGLKSIIEHLGSREFYRLRIGVSRDDRMDLSSYVLGKFSQEQFNLLDEIIERSCEAIESLMVDGLKIAMNKYN
ncbi:MAG: aminoacyl-tRNA hydrolase [Pseudomonadota bacterium]